MIADALQAVALQLETANLLAFNLQPRNAVTMDIGERIGVDPPPAPDSTDQGLTQTGGA